MKYYAHYKNQKIAVLSKDLQIAENQLFGYKWLNNECVFIAYLKNPRAVVFDLIWKFDFFGEKDLFVERKNERGNERVLHSVFDEKWTSVSTCKEYMKVSETKAIVTVDELSYLIDVVKEKSLSVACDKIEETEINGEKLLLMKHKLLEQKRDAEKDNNEYYLLYYIDLDGKVRSSRLNTLTHQYCYFDEKELHYHLEEMKECTKKILKEELLQLKRSIK